MDTASNHSDECTVSEKKPTATKQAKTAVLEFLKEHGCTRANLEAIVRTRRQSPQNIIGSICQSYEDAQLRVSQECDSVSLGNINQWLELMKSAQLDTLCEFEAAAVLNAIVRNEEQPEPAILDDINLKDVYVFLENALNGQPQKKLDAASESFLFSEIELLIADANSDNSDAVARSMGENLCNRQTFNYPTQPNKLSLDPLLLDECHNEEKNN